MLSILIPTYNYDIYTLVTELHAQCVSNNLVFEIIVVDDASSLFHAENNKVNLLPHASYTILKENIGRSRIRNLLADMAHFEWLLFLDADVMPKDANFISTYLGQLTDKDIIINGGILYTEEKPDKSRLLRWIYGTKRESQTREQRENNPYRSFLSLNFLVNKSLFRKIRFNENVLNLRHEDTVFSYNLEKTHTRVKHIDNPVYHLGIDTFEVAIRKEEESLIALRFLLENKLISPQYVKIGHYYSVMRKLRLLPVGAMMYRATKALMLKNLGGESPSMLVCDLYRLGHMCTLSTNPKL